MSGIWVYKFDGTIQCAPANEGEISLDAMKKELSELIGEDNILSQEKRRYPGAIIDLCGAPTGAVNAYEITAKGQYLLIHGIVGTNGFRFWPSGTDSVKSGDDPVPWPLALARIKKTEAAGTAALNILSMLTEVGMNPTTLAEIIGRRCRCYTVGDSLTMDYWPQRVNIELSKDSRISRIWFG